MDKAKKKVLENSLILLFSFLLLELFGFYSCGAYSSYLHTCLMQVRSLSWEDPLEEGITTHSSILAWEIPWTEEPGGLQSTGLQRAGHDGVSEHTDLYTLWVCVCVCDIVQCTLCFSDLTLRL